MNQRNRAIPPIWERLSNEWHTQPTSFVAAVVTLLVAVWNLYISLPTLFEFDHSPDEIDFSLVVRLILFVVLESSLSYAFGVLFVRFTEAGRGMPYMLMIVTAIISAWVSGYNSFWVFATAAASFDGAMFAFVSGEVFAFLIAWYFIYYHYDSKKILAIRLLKEKGRSSEEYLVGGVYERGFYVAFFTQLITFLVIAFHLGFKIQPYIQGGR